MGHIEDVVSTASYGSWFWRASDNRMRGDEVIADLFGIDPERLKTGVLAEEFERTISASDFDRIRALASQSVERNEPYEAIYRVKQPSGVEVWVISRGRCYLDAEGQLSKFVGTTTPLSALEDVAPSLGLLTDLLLEAYQMAEAIEEQTIQACLRTVLMDIACREAAVMRAEGQGL